MSEKKNALSLLADTAKFALTSANLNNAGKVLNAQLVLIRQADPLIAKRAIYVGTALLMVKASLEHGQFGPWLEKHIDDIGRRQVAYYMKLALAALDETRIDATALAALPVTDIDAALTLSTGPAGKLRTAVDAFVGECSLADLLAEYCGKAKGKNKGGAGDSDDASGADEDKPANPAHSLFNEAAEHLQALRITLTDDGALMQLKPKQLDELKDSLTQLQQEFSAKHRQARGKNK